MEDDSWDLQAVVRGYCGSPAGTASATADPLSSFPPLAPQEGWGRPDDDFLLCFPDIFSTPAGLLKLEDPFESFLPDLLPRQQVLLSPQRSASCSTAPQSLPCGDGAVLASQPQLSARQPPQRKLSQAPKSKRRKNQQKKVVCQVPADGLSSDVWAWRKYGQKPIKDSPHPRSYYRCSSSRGCPARKQVERSRTDPGVFIVTFMAEHNHPAPTHRNSLAGSTRQKFPTSSSPPAAATNFLRKVKARGDGGPDPEHTDCKAASCSPMSSPTTAALSPSSPLTASTEEQEEEDLLVVGDMEMLGEDDVLFLGLEQLPEPSGGGGPFLGDVLLEQFGAFLPPWMANNTATAAGGR